MKLSYIKVILWLSFAWGTWICFFYYGNTIFIAFENNEPAILIPQRGNKEIVQNAKRLPTSGKNFETYSRILSTIGRTHVWPDVRDLMIESYEDLAAKAPEIQWIYAETGWKNGGNFWPHKTHRNGMCVDFIVPVKDIKTGQSTMLPVSIFNMYGYNIRFDVKGVYKNYIIDFEAIAMHLATLVKASKNHGMHIKTVILDPPLLKALQKTKHYDDIKRIHFMKQYAWFPHDSHYHIEFEIVGRRTENHVRLKK